MVQHCLLTHDLNHRVLLVGEGLEAAVLHALHVGLEGRGVGTQQLPHHLLQLQERRLLIPYAHREAYVLHSGRTHASRPDRQPTSRVSATRVHQIGIQAVIHSG